MLNVIFIAFVSLYDSFSAFWTETNQFKKCLHFSSQIKSQKMAAHLPFIFFNSFNTAEADYALHDTMYIIHRY